MPGPNVRNIPDGFVHTAAIHLMSSLMESAPYHKYMRVEARRTGMGISEFAVIESYRLAELLFAEAILHE
jgi:hypothetical protein